MAVHGWDIAQACGDNRPIPATLAVSLIAICPLLVTDADRYPQFAPAIAAPRSAAPSDQLRCHAASVDQAPADRRDQRARGGGRGFVQITGDPELLNRFVDMFHIPSAPGSRTALRSGNQASTRRCRASQPARRPRFVPSNLGFAQKRTAAA